MVLLDEQRLDLTPVDAYAVATGPGSFTGLRIGIATMQGLAFAASKPLIGVSGFDALAQLATGSVDRVTWQIATWVDAWRGEVFAARYEGGIQVEAPTVEAPRAILARINHPTLFVGDAVPIYKDVIARELGERAEFAEPAVPMLAGAVAQIAAKLVQAGHTPGPEAIRPLYVRRPDAELARNARTVG